MIPSEEHEAFAESIRQLLDKEFDRDRVRGIAATGHGFDERHFQTMASLGWTGLLVPERHGGSGASLREAGIVLQELGRHLTPSPFAESAVLTTAALLASNRLHLQDRWLPRLADGCAIGTVALCGPSGDLDPPRLGVHAAGCRLNGRAAFVPWGGVAQLIVVAAADAHLYLVDAARPGTVAIPTPTVDVTRRLAIVDFSGAHADELGGPDLRDRVIDCAAVAIAADALGGARQVMEISAEYARDRVQFGRPIGSFQAVKHMCADMLVRVEGSTSAVQEALALDAEPVAAAIAAAYTTDTYAKVAGDALQIHGGIGFTAEHDCHLFLKRAKLDQCLYGSPSWHRERLLRLTLPEAASSSH